MVVAQYSQLQRSLLRDYTAFLAVRGSDPFASLFACCFYAQQGCDKHSGAGVNAVPDIGMSPLSELVWSSDEGLSIKIAASSVTRKASLRWNADTLNIAISSPQQSGGDKSGENIDASVRDSEKMPSQIRSGSESSMRISTANPNITKITDAQQAASIRSLDQDSRCCREVNLLNKVEEVSDNDHIDRMELQEEIGNHSISCCKDASHHHTSCPASRKGVMSHTAEKELHCATTVHGGSSWANNAWRARLVETIGLKNSVLQNKAANTQSPSSIGNLGNARNIEGKLTGFQGDEHNKHLDNVNKDTSAIAASQFHRKLQGRTMQENRMDDPVVVRCESASGFNPRNLEKGKEKVVYNNSNCVSNTKESDDSNESIESCPSTKIPKRKHVHCATIKLPFGNKRCRGEDNESSCSGLVLKSGSSFFNWMSTLTNGLIMFDESTPVPLDRKLSSAIREGFVSSPVSHQNDCSVPLQSVGFNSLFQSLYCHDVMITSRHSHHQTESNHTDHIPNRVALDLESGDCLLDKPICMGTETFHMATETLAANNLQMICAGDTGNSQNQVGPLPLRAQGNLKLSNSSNKSCSRYPEEKENEFCGCSSNMPIENGGGSAESFWVTRLLPRNSMNLVDATPCNVKSDFCTINPKGLDDKLYCSSQQKFGLENECNNIEFFTSKGSNKEITSKCPALPSEKLEQPETMASVFAKRLDVLRHANTSSVCLPITCGHGTPTGENHRNNSFVANYNSHDGLQMEQENHISPSKDGRIVLWLGDKCKEQEYNGSNEELQGKLISESEPQHCGASTAGKAEATHHDNLGAKQFAGDAGGSGVKFKEEALNSMENAPNSKQTVPYGTALNDICDESSVIFGALQRLRLSRSDIIRWLRSPIMHTTLDGFFLRLRFGKWEEALGGTGYHVARINGAVDGNHLSVTIRNSTCQVDSRFVSNHDFHEDELKAWWSAIMKGDCKLPSKEELERKLRERAIIRF